MKVSFKTLAFGFALAIGTLGIFNQAQAGIEPTMEGCRGTNSYCMSIEKHGLILNFLKAENMPGYEIKLKPGN